MCDETWAALAVRSLIERCVRCVVQQLERDVAAYMRRME